MKKQNSPLLRELERLFNPEIQCWEILDIAHNIVELCCRCKGKKQQALGFLIQNFTDTCQDVKVWLQNDLSKNAAIDINIRDSFLRDFDGYTDQIYRWIKNSVNNGQTQVVDYERLKSKRDGIFVRMNGYLISKTEELNKRYSRLKNIISDYEASQKTRAVKVDSAEKPAETKQDITPSKRQRVIARLKNHPHKYGLTVGVIFLILFIVMGLFKAQWRPWCWRTAAIPFLVLIVSLLGGRSR